MGGWVVRLFRWVLRRTPPRPGSVRGARVFRNGGWEPLPRYRVVPSGRGPRSDAPLLAIQCPQPTCAGCGPIGRVWPHNDDGRGLWAADSAYQPNTALHRRAVDAARWVRTQHDAHDHATARWSSEHLDAASAADTAAARMLTAGSEPDGAGSQPPA